MRRLDAAGPALDRGAVSSALAAALASPGPAEVGLLADLLRLTGEARAGVLSAAAAACEGGPSTPRGRRSGGSRLRAVARAPVALVKGAAGLVKGGPTPAPPPKPGATFTAAWADFLEVAGTTAAAREDGGGVGEVGGGGTSGPTPVLSMAPVPPATIGGVLPPPPSLAPVVTGGAPGEIQPAGA
jgi:hypothetical protein